MAKDIFKDRERSEEERFIRDRDAKLIEKMREKARLEEIVKALAESLQVSDPGLLDRAQSVVERAIFDDPDRSVRDDALDALDGFPEDRVQRVLGDVITRHPDPRTRRDAEEHLRERK